MKKKLFGKHASDGSFYEILNGEEALINPDKYFKPGDHIQVSKGVYRHACIYTGKDEGERFTVIQVSDPNGGHSKKKAKVNKALWQDFHCDDLRYHIYLTHFKHRRDKEILDIAQSMVGKLEGEYNVLTKNCQHFAMFCQTGENICLQKKVYLESL